MSWLLHAARQSRLVSLSPSASAKRRMRALATRLPLPLKRRELTAARNAARETFASDLARSRMVRHHNSHGAYHSHE
eukprot:10481689-Alexandrium_andersonii.AAC.1